ncbi:MAG: hypothetical protein J7L23_03315 [Candidatus Diapherotrites archaeon]|nr:hypothetical protein [Candidatus Diapherotrites archaeon]
MRTSEIKLNKKGFLPLIAGIPTALIVLIVVILLLVLSPAILMQIREIKLLFQIFAAIIILSWVRNTVGPGMVSILISLILIYIFVLMVPELLGAIWAMYILLTFGLWSMIFWGLPLIFRK